MKKIFLVLICFWCITGLIAQDKKDSEPYDMNVNGVKVIVQPSGNDIVVITTAIKGGLQNYPKEKAGIENLAITGLTECGTANDDKNSFKNKLDKVSAQVYGGAGKDYSTITLNCIKSDLDAVWPLYADALLKPAFNEKEFERIKQDAINGIRAAEGDPDASLDKLAMQTAFANKPYATDPTGTINSVSSLTAAETKKYWHSVLTRSHMVIVVVADLDKDVIKKKVESMLASVPSGKPFTLKKELYTPNANTLKTEKRDNATNYVQGITAGPAQGSPDYNAFSLAMNMFSNKFFIAIRTNHGLSYSPYAYFSGGATPYASINVTTTNPDKFIAVARHLIDSLQKAGFTEEELNNEKARQLTVIYYRQETNGAMANSYINNEVLHGNWKRTIELNEELKKVTPEQVNNAFKKFIKNITWVYQGDPEKVNPTMYTQKEVPKMPDEKKAF